MSLIHLIMIAYFFLLIICFFLFKYHRDLKLFLGRESIQKKRYETLLSDLEKKHHLQMECKRADFDRFFTHQKELKIQVDRIKTQIFWLLDHTVKKPGVEK